MTPEGKVQAHLKRRVEETGGQFRKLAWEGRRGAPDAFVWWPGPVFAFIELKAPRGRLSGHQVREIARLREAGFQVFTAYTPEQVDATVTLLTGKQA